MNEKRIDVEAKMVYIKHKIEWLKAFIEDRITIQATGTEHHYPQVEERLIELAKTILKENEEKLKNAEKEYGKRPFSEWLDKKASKPS